MPTRAALAACLVACVIVSAAAGQAWAGDPPRSVWIWVDAYGTLSFTDDMKRIPRAYRDKAGRKPIDWPRVTVDQVDSEKRRVALRARLSVLRSTVPASYSGAADGSP